MYIGGPGACYLLAVIAVMYYFTLCLVSVSAVPCRVMDVASKSDEEGFITCPDLHQIFSSVGVKLSDPEVELLATGNTYMIGYF